MKININDIALNYIETGKPQNIPIIFIHGFPFSHLMWEPQLSALPGSVHAIAYDIRGHGSSSVGDGQYTIDLFVDDLIALIDRLDMEKAVLCGLSMGGYIALRTIERYAERVAGLILCDTKSEPDSNDAKINRASSIRSIKANGVNVFAEEFVKNIFWERTFDKNPGIVTFIKQIISANPLLGICGTQIALAARTDTSSVLSAIRIPTCIIVGEHDKLIPSSSVQAMHKSITGSELHILSNAAHMTNLENTKDFNNVLFNFLDKHFS
jgi:3-oxoadipate enol-lactonase